MLKRSSKFNTIAAAHLRKFWTLASLFLALNGSPSLAAWVQPTELPDRVQTINVVSGVPLNSVEDPSGGFGDVAANINSALELKKMNPTLTVNLLVTNEFEARPGTRNTREILKVMLPQLDPELYGVAQNYRGVNFIFLSEDADHLGDIEQLKTQEQVERLKSEVPKADLSLQLSANYEGLDAALQTNSKIAFSFIEPGVGKTFLDTSFGGRSRPDDPVPLFSLHAGIRTMGYYLEQEENPSSRTAARVRLGLAKDEKLLFAYSKYPQSTDAYLRAAYILASANPQLRFRLFVKEFSEVKLKAPPGYLTITSKSLFTHDEMHDLIVASDYSPLVTGDTSLSIALSSTTPEKTFVYEAPPWKVIAAEDVIQEFKSWLSPRISEARLERAFLFAPNRLSTSSELNSMAEGIYRGLVDKELHVAINLMRRNNSSTWNVHKNSFKFYQFYRAFSAEWANRIMSAEYAEFILRRLRSTGSLTELAAESKRLVLDGNLSGLEAIFHALLVLKYQDAVEPVLEKALLGILSRSYYQDQDGRHWLALAALLEKPAVASFLSHALSFGGEAEYLVGQNFLKIYKNLPDTPGLKPFQQPYWDRINGKCDEALRGP